MATQLQFFFYSQAWVHLALALLISIWVNMSEGTDTEQTTTKCESTVQIFDVRFWNAHTFFVPTTTAATPTQKALLKELKLVTDWHSLGINLDLQSHHLKIIQRNFGGDDQRCKAEMLACWLQSVTAPTWEAVVEALDQMDECQVASKIRRNYSTSTITTEGINCL